MAAEVEASRPVRAKAWSGVWVVYHVTASGMPTVYGDFVTKTSADDASARCERLWGNAEVRSGELRQN